MLVQKGGKIKNWGWECRDVTPTKSLSQNIRVDENREVKFCENAKKKIYFFFFLGGGRGRGRFGGGQGGCERRIKVFVKIQKKIRGGGGVGLGGGGGVRGM